MTKFPFEGSLNFEGCIVNAERLMQNIPEELKPGNPWYDYANDLLIHGSKDWVAMGWSKCKVSNYDLGSWNRMVKFFKSVFGSNDFNHVEKVKLCGWMLSTMLSNVPPRRAFMRAS